MLEFELEDVPLCPLCGQRGGEEVDHTPDSLVGEINRYLPAGMEPLPAVENRRKRCAACGLIFLSPRLSRSSLALVYERWYAYAYRRVFADATHGAQRIKEFKRYHLRFLQAFASPPGRLLDVGCGSGHFLRIAADRGWAVTGIDFDAATAQAAASAQGVEVRVGRIEQALSPGEKYEAITMFDFLEHSDAPGQALDLACEHLQPGGYLCVRVPNQGGWQSRWMGKRWLAVISNHLSYFDRDVLRDALTSRNLRVRALGAGNFRSEADIAAAHLRWARTRLRKAPGTVPVRAPVQEECSGRGGAVRRLARSLFLEQLDHVGGWLGQGNNLMAVAQKPEK